MFVLNMTLKKIENSYVHRGDKQVPLNLMRVSFLSL